MIRVAICDDDRTILHGLEIALRADADLDLTLYDEADHPLQHTVIPRAFLLGIERTFRETAAQVQNNVADKPNRCVLQEQAIIKVA